MARNLTDQVREIAEVTKSVARGDLTKTVDADVQGEILDLKITVNEMVSIVCLFKGASKANDVGCSTYSLRS